MHRLAILGENFIDQLVAQIFLLKAGFKAEIVVTASDVCRSLDQGSVLDCIIVVASENEVDGKSAAVIAIVRSWETTKHRPYRHPLVAIIPDRAEHLKAECLTAGADAFLTFPLVYSVVVNIIYDLIEIPESIRAIGQ